MFDNPTLMKILLKLPFEEALEKQLVCSAFHEVITDSFFWDQKIKQDFGEIDHHMALNDSKQTYLFYEEKQPHSIKNLKNKNQHIFSMDYNQYFEKAVKEGNLVRLKAHFRCNATYLADGDVESLLRIAYDNGYWEIYWYIVDHYFPKTNYKLWENVAEELLLHNIEGEPILRLIDKSGGFPGTCIRRNIGRVKNVHFLLKFYMKYHEICIDMNKDIFRGIGEAQNVDLFEKYINYVDITPLYIRQTLYGAVLGGSLEFVVYLRDKYVDVITAREILFALLIRCDPPNALILKYALMIAKETGCLHSEETQNSIRRLFKYVSKEELLEIVMKWISNM